MVQSAAQRLTDHLQNRIEEGLRTVVVIREDGFDVEYLRKDLSGEYTRETFGEVVDRFRLKEPFMAPGIESRPVGERRAIVHYHRNAFVIQIPYSDSESILISLTPDTGRDLLDFVEECRRKVAGQQ